MPEKINSDNSKVLCSESSHQQRHTQRTARLSTGRCIKKMAQAGKTINDLAPELITMILQHVPERYERVKYGHHAPGHANSLLNWGQLSTGVCFGLTSRRHWAIFRSLVPKGIPLYPALSQSAIWSTEPNWFRWTEKPEPDSLIFLLKSWIGPNYRIPHQDKGCPAHGLRMNFISCNTYGKDTHTKSHEEEERQVKLNGWKTIDNNFIPHPFNMGKDWYFATGQVLKAKVLAIVQDPTRDPRREECNWDRFSYDSYLLGCVSITIMVKWLKAVVYSTPIHFDPRELDRDQGIFVSKTRAAELVEDILMIPDDKCNLNIVAQRL